MQGTINDYDEWFLIIFNNPYGTNYLSGAVLNSLINSFGVRAPSWWAEETVTSLKQLGKPTSQWENNEIITK